MSNGKEEHPALSFLKHMSFLESPSYYQVCNCMVKETQVHIWRNITNMHFIIQFLAPSNEKSICNQQEKNTDNMISTLQSSYIKRGPDLPKAVVLPQCYGSNDTIETSALLAKLHMVATSSIARARPLYPCKPKPKKGRNSSSACLYCSTSTRGR
jgi:hypothetical protein